MSDDPGAVERLHGGHGFGVSRLDSAPTLAKGAVGTREAEANAREHRSVIWDSMRIK